MRLFYLFEPRVLPPYVYCFFLLQVKHPSGVQLSQFGWVGLKARGGQAYAGRDIFWIPAAEMSNLCWLRQTGELQIDFCLFLTSLFPTGEMCTFSWLRSKHPSPRVAEKDTGYVFCWYWTKLANYLIIFLFLLWILKRWSIATCQIPKICERDSLHRRCLCTVWVWGYKQILIWFFLGLGLTI